MEILSVKKVVELTGFSKSFVYHFFRELGGQKIGGKIFFHRDKLEEALKNDSQETERPEVELRVPVPRQKVFARRVRHEAGGRGSGDPTPQDIAEALKRHNLG